MDDDLQSFELRDPHGLEESKS